MTLYERELLEQHGRFQRIVAWYWRTAGPYPTSVTEVEAGSEVARRSEVASDRETRAPASATSPHLGALSVLRDMLETARSADPHAGGLDDDDYTVAVSALDNLEEQLQVEERNVIQFAERLNRAEEQLEAKQAALEKIAHGELTFDNMREIARAECSHSFPAKERQ